MYNQGAICSGMRSIVLKNVRSQVQRDCEDATLRSNFFTRLVRSMVGPPLLAPWPKSHAAAAPSLCCSVNHSGPFLGRHSSALYFLTALPALFAPRSISGDVVHLPVVAAKSTAIAPTICPAARIKVPRLPSIARTSPLLTTRSRQQHRVRNRPDNRHGEPLPSHLRLAAPPVLVCLPVLFLPCQMPSL